MKLTIAILLACILGAVLGNIVNSAFRDMSPQKAACRGKAVML